jgi:P4 family phage/plasmid primase-like protien
MEDSFLYKLEFTELMESVRLNKNQENGETPHTVVCFGKPWGKYNIDDTIYNKFINYYKRVVFSDDFHIIERHVGKKVGPLLLDIDYKVDKKYGERLYRDEHIYKLVKYATNIIKKYLILSEPLEAFVTEKQVPSFIQEKGIYKDGFHIHFPIAVTPKMRYFLFNKIKQKGIEKKLFDDIPFTNEKGYDEIFDDSVLERNGWCMYGSKKEKGQLYTFTQLFKNGEYENINKYDTDELVSILSIRRFVDDDELEIKEKYKNDREFLDELEKYYKEKGKKIKISNKNEEQEYVSAYKQASNKKLSEKELNTVKKLVNLLSKKRASNYNDWIYVGWALYNIDASSLLPTFKEFSKKSPEDYDEYGCDKVWKTAKLSNLTIGSLHTWAQQDDKNGYLEVIKEDMGELLKDAETGNHDDIAKLVYEIYKYNYICVSIKSNQWYEFQKHKWVPVENAYTLSNKLSDHVTKFFLRLRNGLLTIAQNQDGEDYDNTMKKVERLKKIVDKLKNQSFKNQVISACACRFYDKQFEEKLNNNKDIFAFENGVFDLKESKFRDGLPDDMVSITCGYEYKDFKKNSPEIMEVLHYWNIIQTEEDIREYTLTNLATFTDGHARNQKFHIWTGTGCHVENTKILMADGSYKMVQDISFNDYIMGDDSKSRRIKMLFRGEEECYKIVLDNNIDEFIVNKNHKLALRCNYKVEPYKTLNIFDEECYGINYYKYLDNVPIKMSRTFDTLEKAEEFITELKTRDEFFIDYGQSIPIKVMDYINITTLNYINNENNDYNDINDIKKHFGIYTNPIIFKRKNISIEEVKKYLDSIDIINLDDRYNNTSYNIRMYILGYIIEKYMISNKVHSYLLPYKIIINENINYIIRSLGLKIIKEDDNIRIVGYNINDIVISKEKRTKKNPTNTSKYYFDYKIKEVISVGNQKYYGFELDANNKYYMGNFTITYNSNGKSTTLDLIQYTFGQYFGVLPTTVLTRKRGNASGATPELADKNGKRVLVIQEPEHDDQVYVGLMKNLTGNDWIEARALYGNPFRYKPQFKLILICNKLPNIPANDGGTWRRIRVTPWESQFVDHEPDINKKEFKKDPGLIEKLENWKQAFAWILLNIYYPKYIQCNYKINEPAKVTQYTDNYQKTSDTYLEFIQSHIIETRKKREYATISTAYEVFKQWCKVTGSNTTSIPAKKDFLEYLKNKNYDIKDGKLVGYTISYKVDEDETCEDDDDEENNNDLNTDKKNEGKKKSKISKASKNAN